MVSGRKDGVGQEGRCRTGVMVLDRRMVSGRKDGVGQEECCRTGRMV